MFNMIGIGERAGSGVPDIFAVWSSQGWTEPIVEEQYDPDRTILTLVFSEKQAEKTGGKNKRKKTGGNGQAHKTAVNKELIIVFLASAGEGKTTDIAHEINLSLSRTRVLLSELTKEGRIRADGNGRSRRYSLPESFPST